MDGITRRSRLKKLLQQSEQPISGKELARTLGVSRQIIVQDIALLRAEQIDILATNCGYLLYPSSQCSQKKSRLLHTSHTTEEIEDELYTIVDSGGSVRNVFVHHKLYGEITVDLIIKSRSDVDAFVTQVNEKKISPLKELTGGEHFHLVEAESEVILDTIEKALAQKGYLLP